MPPRTTGATASSFFEEDATTWSASAMAKSSGWPRQARPERESPVPRGAADRAARRGRSRRRHYELLVRMRDDSGRTVPPGAFLPAVERSNLSVRYDRWIIMHALQWLAKQRDRASTRRAASSSTCRATRVADLETPAVHAAERSPKPASTRSGSASRSLSASRSATWHGRIT